MFVTTDGERCCSSPIHLGDLLRDRALLPSDVGAQPPDRRSLDRVLSLDRVRRRPGRPLQRLPGAAAVPFGGRVSAAARAAALLRPVRRGRRRERRDAATCRCRWRWRRSWRAVWTLQRTAARLPDLGERIAWPPSWRPPAARPTPSAGVPAGSAWASGDDGLGRVLRAGGRRTWCSRHAASTPFTGGARSDPSMLKLANGNTLHGAQDLAPAAPRARSPITAAAARSAT